MSPYFADNEVDLRSNLSQEVRNNVIDSPFMQVEQVKIPLGPITRARVKKISKLLQTLVKFVQEQVGVPKAIEGLDNSRIINVIKFKEGGHKPIEAAYPWSDY